MNSEEIRAIPGYQEYGVTEYGIVVSFQRNLILNWYILNGYLVVDTFRGSLTETLPVHRAVALAWVHNTNLELFQIVNHRDGNPMNNYRENLEWTNHSGNNYHAVNTGLRNDNISCRVRDFYSKEVFYFSSMAQAAEFMGLPKDAPYERLCPKMFGKLIADRYEFRYANDPTPWFYENRSELVPPSRFMVTVKEPTGEIRDVFSNRALLQDYQLYGSPGKSIQALAEYGNQIYPDREFVVRDSYIEQRHRETRNTQESRTMPVTAFNGKETLPFSSLTQCAKHFQVDRSSILGRLNNGKDLDGWTFTQMPL